MDYLDKISGTAPATSGGDYLDKIAAPEPIAAHTTGEALPMFRKPTINEQREVTGVSRPSSKIFKTPEETKQAAIDLGTTAVDAAMGVSEGVTLGLTSPLVDEAHKAMPTLGMTPNPVAEGTGKFIGTVAPWSGIAKGVEAAFGLSNATRIGRVATQGLTGATVGGVTAQNEGRDAADEAAIGGIAGAAFQGAMELPGAVKDSNWFRMLTNKERGLVVQTYDDLAKAGWSEAEMARMNPEYFQASLKKRMATENNVSEPIAEAAPTPGIPVQGKFEAPVTRHAVNAEPQLPVYSPEVNQGGFDYLDKIATPLQSEVIPNGTTERQTTGQGIDNADGQGGQNGGQGLLNAPPVSESLNTTTEGASSPSPFLHQADVHVENLKKTLIDSGIDENHPAFEKIIGERRNRERQVDPVTGWELKEDHEATLERALDDHTATGRAFAYVDIDIHNLGGLNKHMGSNEEANTHFKGMTDLVKEYIEFHYPQAQFFKQGGDELSILVPDVAKDDLHKVMAEAQKYVDAYAQQEKLSEIKHSKEGSAPGTGINFGVTDFVDKKNVKDILKSADSITAGNKIQRGLDYVTRSQVKTPGPMAHEGQSSSVTESVRADSNGNGRTTDEYRHSEEDRLIFEASARDLIDTSAAGGGHDNHFVDGNRTNRSWGTTDMVAPWFNDPSIGVTREKAIEVLRNAAQGKYPPQKNVDQWRVLDGALEHGRSFATPSKSDYLTDFAEQPIQGNGDTAKAPQKDTFTPRNDGKLFATPPAFGHKPQGKGTVSENPMFTEMKERAAEKQQTGFGFSGGGHADTGGYDLSRKSSIELPEITEIAKELMNGKYPHVLVKLRRRGALGTFKTGKGSIDLKAEIFKTPGLAERVLAHEVGHLVDWLPDQSMKRGNILGRVASLKKYLKKMLDDSASGITPVDRNTITAELKNLTQQWKPFNPIADPKYTKYRFSSVELYADAVSVLVNDPAFLKQVAPTFKKAFFEYLHRKPEVQQVYGEIQQRLKDPAAVRGQRQENVREMFGKGEAAKKETERKPFLDILHSLRKDLIDTNTDLIMKVEKAIKQGKIVADEDNPVYWVEQLPYVSSEVYNHLRGIDKAVLEPMAKDGITVDDLGEYMMFKRITGDRAELANPLGHTADTAAAQLGFLKQKLGDATFTKLEDYVSKYREIREKNIVKLVEKSGMWSDELMQHVKNNDDYATFDVQKFIEQRYGRQAGAQVYKQIGTLQEIRNPFIATVMKDAALIRAANIKIAKAATTDFMGQHFPDEIQPADTRWNGKAHEPVEPKDPNQGMILYPVKGKLEAYYVPKGIAEIFNRNPYEASAIVKGWQIMNQPLRAILVSHNPMWMVANLPRDFIATWKNVKGMTLIDLIKYYQKAAPIAYRDVFKDEQGETLSEMLKGKMLVTDRQFSDLDQAPDSELDRMLEQFGKSPVQYRNKVIKPFVQFWELLGKAGKFTERQGKIAGYMAQKDSGVSPMETAHNVRSKIGTPDVKRGGRLMPIYNNIFLFSNVGKEGWRSSWESYKDSPFEYFRKTVQFNIIPKLLMKAAALGLMGTAYQNLMEKVSDYDSTNFITVPIGTTGNGKAVYLRIPQDYTGQVVSGIVWMMMKGKFIGEKGLLSYTSEQAPYGLNPYLSAITDLLQYTRGQNPYDDYRGKTVIPDQNFKAGGWYSTEPLLKYEWNQLGGGVLYKFSGDGPDKVETELEKALKLPGGNVFGRFLKVSDQGEREKLRFVTDEVGKDNARQSLNVKDSIIKDINSKDGKPTVSDMVKLYRKLLGEKKLDFDTKFSNFRPRYERYLSKVGNSAKIDAVANAQGNEEKAALLQHYKDTLPAGEYQAIIKQLILENHVKRGALREMLLRSNGIK